MRKIRPASRMGSDGCNIFVPSLFTSVFSVSFGDRRCRIYDDGTSRSKDRSYKPLFLSFLPNAPCIGYVSGFEIPVRSRPTLIILPKAIEGTTRHHEFFLCRRFIVHIVNFCPRTALFVNASAREKSAIVSTKNTASFAVKNLRPRIEIAEAETSRGAPSRGAPLLRRESVRNLLNYNTAEGFSACLNCRSKSCETIISLLLSPHFRNKKKRKSRRKERIFSYGHLK